MCADDIYVPEFLNNREKWENCVSDTDNVVKFEKVMNKLLEDERMSSWDFYIIMCTLNHDLEEYHKNDSFTVLLELVEALINYYYYQTLVKSYDTN